MGLVPSFGECPKEWYQASEMSFLALWLGLTVETSEFRVESLLLYVGRCHLRWLEHLIRMPPRRFLLEVFLAHATGRRHLAGPPKCWRDYIAHVAWERLRVPQRELDCIVWEKDVWVSCSVCRQWDLVLEKQQKMDEWMDWWVHIINNYCKPTCYSQQPTYMSTDLHTVF